MKYFCTRVRGRVFGCLSDLGCTGKVSLAVEFVVTFEEARINTDHTSSVLLMYAPFSLHLKASRF